MNSPIWLWERLPELLLLMSGIGFLASLSTELTGRRPQASLFTAHFLVLCVILGVIFWKFECDSATESASRIVSETDLSAARSAASAAEMVHRRADKLRAVRLSGKWFVVDGINLWPVVVLVVLTAFVVRRKLAERTIASGFVTTSQLFLLSAIAALTANDVRVYLFAYAANGIVMTVMIGVWGGTQRRTIVERFFVFQFCGGSFVMLGLAMLVMAVPWMKMEDSPGPPTINFEISNIIDEISKWTTSNELAFQYANFVFPWMLILLSVGFAISFGLFPFHSVQTSILGRVSVDVATLYFAGFAGLSSVSWWRIVVPIAPDQMASFVWLVLLCGTIGACWGAFGSFAPASGQKRAHVILCLLSVSCLGCDALSRAGMAAAWLMQQQLIMLFGFSALVFEQSAIEASTESSTTAMSRRLTSKRIAVLLYGIACVGFFASGFTIVAELSRETLLLPLVILVVATLCFSSTCSVVAKELKSVSVNGVELAAVVILALVTNLCPGALLRQSELEFARTFRRFEGVVSAVSAEPDTDDRQSPPRIE